MVVRSCGAFSVVPDTNLIDELVCPAPPRYSIGWCVCVCVSTCAGVLDKVETVSYLLAYVLHFQQEKDAMALLSHNTF